MSDFDKEAERQRLREKYERDEEKREATQRMSELLLKGATMTNRHCDECGDPIFRYDGQEFCPTCQNAQVAGGQQPAEGEQAQPSPAENGQQPETGETEAAAEPEAETVESDTAEAATEDEDESRSELAETVDVSTQTPESTEAGERDTTSTGPEQRATPTEQGTAPSNRVESGANATNTASSTGAPSNTGTSSNAGSAGGDLADARAALQRSIARYAREGENADDPRRAQELFAAAREAAETLAALNR